MHFFLQQKFIKEGKNTSAWKVQNKDGKVTFFSLELFQWSKVALVVVASKYGYVGVSPPPSRNKDGHRMLKSKFCKESSVTASCRVKLEEILKCGKSILSELLQDPYFPKKSLMSLCFFQVKRQVG